MFRLLQNHFYQSLALTTNAGHPISRVLSWMTSLQSSLQWKPKRFCQNPVTEEPDGSALGICHPWIRDKHCFCFTVTWVWADDTCLSPQLWLEMNSHKDRGMNYLLALFTFRAAGGLCVHWPSAVHWVSSGDRQLRGLQSLWHRAP